MPRPRFRRLEPQRRAEILETAAQQFAAHGYEQASLNQLLEGLGLSKGSFYYYFDDKADLFEAVLTMVWERCLPDGPFDPSALDRDSFWPRVEEMVRANRDLGHRFPWIVGITRLLRDPPPAPQVKRLVAEKMAEVRDWQLALLRRGQQVGAVRDDMPLELLAAILSGADGAADRWLLLHWEGLDPDERERLLDALFLTVRGMLAPPSGEPE